MKCIGIVVVFAIGLCGTAMGQGEGYGGFTTGSEFLDVKSLNDALNLQGIEDLTRENLILGGCGYGVLKERIIIGGEGFGTFPQSVESDSVKGEFSAGAGFFDIGYVLASTKASKVYSLMGIGGGGLSLRLVPKDGFPNFDELYFRTFS